MEKPEVSKAKGNKILKMKDMKNIKMLALLEDGALMLGCYG